VHYIRTRWVRMTLAMDKHIPADALRCRPTSATLRRVIMINDGRWNLRFPRNTRRSVGEGLGGSPCLPTQPGGNRDNEPHHILAAL